MRILTDVTVYNCCYCKRKQCINHSNDLLTKCLGNIRTTAPSSKCNKDGFTILQNYTGTADMLSGKIMLKSATCDYHQGSCFANNMMAVWSNKSEPLKVPNETCNFKKLSLTTDAYTLTVRNRYIVFDTITQGLALEIVNKSRFCNKTVFLTSIKGLILSNETIEDNWDTNFHNLTFLSREDLLRSLGPNCLYDRSTLEDLIAEIEEIKTILFYVLIAIVFFIALYIGIALLNLLRKWCSNNSTKSERTTNIELENITNNGAHRRGPPTEVAYNNDLYGTQQ